MKSKLYKNHRKASYYRLRRLGYFSLSMMIVTVSIVVPLTLLNVRANTSIPSSSFINSSTSITSETTMDIELIENIALEYRHR
jgi:hypothetical protein